MGDTPRRDAPKPGLLTRRSLLHFSTAAIASSFLAPHSALAAIAARPERALQLHHAHTGESFTGTYWREGRYIPQSIEQISELMRDQHTDEVLSIDPRLLDLLHALQRQFGTRQAIDVVCGYRSAATNALLREEGERGVAKHSYHITGQAVDVRLRDGNLRQLYNAARALNAGGVGYYGRAHFVHLDVGEVRHWEIGAGPMHPSHLRPRSRPHSTRQS